MKKFDRLIIRAFLYLSPAVVAAVIIDRYFSPMALPEFLNAVLGLALVFWMLSAFYISIKLLASPDFRNQTLKRMASLRERDEREVMVSGRAMRNNFLATLAILIFCLCLSLFKISVYKVPESQAVNGNTGTLSLQFNTDMLGEKVAVPAGKDQPAVTYFAYPGLPLSNTAIFLFLILWQIFSYNYFVKRIESGRENMLELEVNT